MKDFDAYEYKLFTPDSTGGRVILDEKRLFASFKFKPRVRFSLPCTLRPISHLHLA
jgi:hypothetical protein